MEEAVPVPVGARMRGPEPDGSKQRAMRRPRGSTSKSVGRRGGGDRGAVLVEAAFVLPILVVLVMGIIDFGFVFNDWISVRQGARDGMRQMIVKANVPPPTGSTSWSCPTTGGPAAGTDAYSVMCFTKSRVGLDQTNTRVKVAFNTTNGYKAGQPVKICVQYKTGSITGMFNSVLQNKVLDTDVESLIEQDDTSMAVFAETPITSWPASCDQY